MKKKQAAGKKKKNLASSKVEKSNLKTGGAEGKSQFTAAGIVAPAGGLKALDSAIINLKESLELRIEERTAELAMANKNLKEEIARREQKEEQLYRLNRTLKALRHSSESISKSESEKEFLDKVCKIIIEDCGHAMVWIGYKEYDECKSVCPVAFSGFEEGYLETLKITWDDTERGQGPTGTAVRTGKPSFCKNMLNDPKFEPWREHALKRGYASSLVLPLFSEEKVFGALTIYFKKPDPFTEDEVTLLSELANDLSYGIQSIRLREAHRQAEETIKQQLEELRISNDELQRFNRVSVDRELRMIELKKEVNRLSELAGLPLPYELESEYGSINIDIEKNDQSGKK